VVHLAGHQAGQHELMVEAVTAGADHVGAVSRIEAEAEQGCGRFVGDAGHQGSVCVRVRQDSDVGHHGRPDVDQTTILGVDRCVAVEEVVDHRIEGGRRVAGIARINTDVAQHEIVAEVESRIPGSPVTGPGHGEGVDNT